MERRTHKRAPLDVIIYCRSSQAIVEGTAEDVSPGGILVKTAKTSPRNEKLDVFFKVPGSAQAIEAGVQVVRSEPGVFMGLAFLDLSPESENVIQQYLTAQSLP